MCVCNAGMQKEMETYHRDAQVLTWIQIFSSAILCTKVLKNVTFQVGLFVFFLTIMTGIYEIHSCMIKKKQTNTHSAFSCNSPHPLKKSKLILCMNSRVGRK